MKISEIVWKAGKRYKDNNGTVWMVNHIETELIHNKTLDSLRDEIDLKHISEMKFEEYVCWELLPVDTKVLVSHDPKDTPKLRYFKEYQKGSDYPFIVFTQGSTSWSSGGKSTGFKCCELAE